jgi:hypothetical protein
MQPVTDDKPAAAPVVKPRDDGRMWSRTDSKDVAPQKKSRDDLNDEIPF